MADDPHLTPENLYAALRETEPVRYVFQARSADEARYCREELGLDAVAPQELPRNHPSIPEINRAMRRHPRA